MPWEVLTARLKVDGGCYSVTLAVDSDRHTSYIARYCADPYSDPHHRGVNMSRPSGLGITDDVFEATEICNRDMVQNNKKPR